MNQIPNIISIFRTLFAIFLAITILNDPDNENLMIFAFWFTIFIIVLDGVDGIIARQLKSESDFGAFFDIACDRIVELIYLSLFVALQWIPFGILAIFLVRGILVDGIRGFASKEGKTPFGEIGKKSMMETKLGHFLTSSRFMRASYGLIKTAAFALMFLVKSIYPEYIDIEMFLIYLMTFYCVIRGVPVLIEGRKYF